jgi:hypothetical protein
VTSFTDKQLRVTFILAGTNQVFPGTNSNTLILTGLRTSAKVDAVARLSTTMDLRVYGMLAVDMNALTVAWANPPVVLNHLVILEAKDSTDPDPTRGWVQVFKGTIKEAQPEFRAQPDVYFQVLAMTGYFQKITPAEPTSYPFQVDIGVAADDIVTRMGFTYVDGGATGVLTNPYFYGTLWDQLAQACQAANADFYFQGDTVLVVPAGRPRTTQPAVILNPASGLIGYPCYSGAGLEVSAIFNPAFLCGTPVQIETVVPSATGRWYPIKLQHILEAKQPKGQWQTRMQCLRVLV